MGDETDAGNAYIAVLSHLRAETSGVEDCDARVIIAPFDNDDNVNAVGFVYTSNCTEHGLHIAVGSPGAVNSVWLDEACLDPLVDALRGMGYEIKKPEGPKK